MRFDKGGTVTTLLRNGEAEKPLGENEYYGFVSVNGKVKISRMLTIHQVWMPFVLGRRTRSHHW